MMPDHERFDSRTKSIASYLSPQKALTLIIMNRHTRTLACSRLSKMGTFDVALKSKPWSVTGKKNHNTKWIQWGQFCLHAHTGFFQCSNAYEMIK